MFLFHSAQALLLLSVIALVGWRLRELCFRRAIDSAPFRLALQRRIRARQMDDARLLRDAARPAFVADVLDPFLDEGDATFDARVLEGEVVRHELEAEAERGLRPLRILGSVASALGFFGAAASILWVVNGDHGLDALAAGRVESLGLSHAVLSIAFGVATSSVALGSWTALRPVARTHVGDLRRIVSSTEELLDPEGPLRSETSEDHSTFEAG